MRLQVINLSKDFHGLRALQGVSFELTPGEVLGLIGPNGSGKTTTINLISGFVPPTAGHIIVDGRELTGKAPHVIARHGVRRTFQTIRLFKALSVHDNLLAAALATGQSHRQAHLAVKALLAHFGIAHLADNRAGTLPYGDERRVEIARALIARPRYLLLDEPAAGMNEAESDTLLAQLRAVVADYGCGLLIIDHDMRLIMRLCDRLHVLNYGQTVAEGTPDVVRQHPEVVRAYLGVTC